jgi:Ser/Thr protein kinase RdoA (MazF antagonist)
MSRMHQLLQMLGVLQPELREAANWKAIEECAPKLKELVENAKTEEEKRDIPNAFKRIVEKRTDEIVLEMVAARR